MSEQTERSRAPAQFGGVTSAAIVAAGSLIWSLPFLVRLASTNERWWIARDDGVITLSHARNFVEFGTIGVSPGGDRVEGFSSPLHFVVASLVQLVERGDAVVVSMVILGVSLAIAGGVLTFGFRRHLHRTWGPDRSPRSEVIALAIIGVIGVSMSSMWTTTGWLGSGMENPLILVSLGAVVAGILAGVESASGRRLATTGLSCLVIARVEFAAFSVPAIVAVAATAVSTTAVFAVDGARWRVAARLAVVPLSVAVVVHLVRRWYFGAWLPNTAIVQGRESGPIELVSAALIGLAVIVPFVALIVRRFVRDPFVRRAVDVVGALGACCLIAVVLWLDASGRLAGSIDAVVLQPGILPLGLAVAVAIGARAAIGGPIAPDEVNRAFVFAGLIALPVAQFLVTGPSRLEPGRVLGLAVPVLLVWLIVELVDLVGVLGAVWPASLSVGIRRVSLLVASSVVVIAVAAVAVTARTDRARALPYEIGWAAEIDDVAERVRQRELGGLGHVITANPDLGKVSYAKHSIMVDLGWLGDPVLATLRDQRPELLDRYLTAVAVPDVVESHSGWSCAYRGWLESQPFVDGYELVDQPGVVWTRPGDTCPADGLRAIWVRTGDDVEAEYRVSRELLGDADPATVVDAALEACRDADGDVWRCQSVRRSVQRVAQVLRERGEFDEAVARFSLSPTAEFDQAMLHRRAGWWWNATEELIEHFDTES